MGGVGVEVLDHGASVISREVTEGSWGHIHWWPLDNNADQVPRWCAHHEAGGESG